MERSSNSTKWFLQPLLEQMIALTLLAYVVGVWFGEAIRDVVYGKLDIAQVPDALLNKPQVDANELKWLTKTGHEKGQK